VGRLLTETRAHVGFILRPAGEQALANVLHIAELARQYEASGGISFRGFIDELRTAAEREAAEAPILEETSDGVRLMTVHKAKGLEFPVVILADLTCRMSRPDASRYVDASRGLCAIRLAGWAPHDLHEHEAEEVARDEAEGVRLAYVAATRARDLLVVPAVGDEPWEGGWLAPLNDALYPPPAARRVASRGPKCPPFRSKDTVFERPGGEIANARTVCPGLHAFDAGYSVVWWEPGPGGGLHLGARPPFGVRREELIVKDVPKSVVSDGRTAYDAWRLSRHEAREAGARPSIPVRTVREWAGSAESPAGDVPISVVDVGRGADSDAYEQGGASFGVLVHAVLAQTPLDAAPADLEAAAMLEARILGLDAPVASAAAALCARVLAHDVIGRARAAAARGRCRRESPVTLRIGDGTLVEGVVDLAFEEQGRWVVVDYKTDRAIAAAGEEHYRRQVGLYADAIRQATGMPAEAVLLRL
jgi:ATP-dependent exoDNAse (exonuclease V) beta subunit